MAAPSPISRPTPVGRPMKDGYRCLIGFSAKPAVLFWEKSLTPPGLDGGESIPTSTMHNDDWRTFAPRALVTLTEATARVAYNAKLYDDILSMLNVEQTITCWFSAGDWLSFYGFLRSFEADEMTEGAQPEATVTITPTNWDYLNNVEAAPQYGT